jgi:hypothetical protein
MTVTAYNAFWNGAPIALQGGIPTVVVKLRVPNTGNYVLFGKVTISNSATTPQGLLATLTTNDGTMILDLSEVVVPGNAGACLVVQGVLNLAMTNENEIVDIRCTTTNGTASWAQLTAIPVDALSPSLGT